jgi:hypothetical protein
MWAGVGCVEVVTQLLNDRHESGKRNAGFSPRRQAVSTSLKKAFVSGKLTLFVLTGEASRSYCQKQQVPSCPRNPVPLPKELLGCVFVDDDHGRLPRTFAIRPSRKLAASDRLFAVLNCCHDLVVRKDDVRRWFRLERKKRRWPSQETAYATPKRKPVGRPSKLDAALNAAILTIAAKKGWTGARPITELHRLLASQGLLVPSVDALARGVDALFAKLGEPALARRRRVRRHPEATRLKTH